MRKSIIVIILFMFLIQITPVFASLGQSKELDEVDRRISAAVSSMQAQIDNLRIENSNLRLQLLGIKNPPATTPNVIVDPNMASLTGRVYNLETTCATKTSVGKLTSQVVSILKKLGLK